MARPLLSGRPMPSMLHEVLVQLFRDRPALAPELLRDVLGQGVPEFDEVRLAEANLSQALPTELRADLVVLLYAGEPVLGIVVEAQLRPDHNKRFVWPLYLAALRAEHRCPCCLLVVTPSKATARWAALAISLGPTGDVVRPLVIGPQTIPAVMDFDQARRMPELAVLSAQAHGRTAAGFQVALAAIVAVAGLERANAMLYYDLIMHAVNEQVRRQLEEVMRIEGYEYQSEFAKRYFSEGRTKGREQGRQEGREQGRQEGRQEGRMQAKADALVRLLELRKLDLSEAQRARILQCQDGDLLQRWFDRAVTATHTNEVFH